MIGFLHGELGAPPGGWPEPFRGRALAGRPAPRPPVELGEGDREALDTDRRGTLSRLLFPGPARDFAAVRETFGDVSVLDTLDYLYGLRAGEEHVVELERGVRLIAGLEAVGEADDRGMRTVMCTLNGQLRPIQVRDRSVRVDVRRRGAC